MNILFNLVFLQHKGNFSMRPYKIIMRYFCLSLPQDLADLAPYAIAEASV